MYLNTFCQFQDRYLLSPGGTPGFPFIEPIVLFSFNFTCQGIKPFKGIIMLFRKSPDTELRTAGRLEEQVKLISFCQAP